MNRSKAIEMYHLLVICGLLFVASSEAYGKYSLKSMVPQPASIDPCFDEDRPRRCMSDFVNVAFGSMIEASSTCGTNGPEKFCEVDGKCHTCDINDSSKSFTAAALSDIHNLNNVTCWRSEPRPLSNTNFGSFENSPDNVSDGQFITVYIFLL